MERGVVFPCDVRGETCAEPPAPAGSSGPVRVALIVREGHVRVKEKGRAEATDAVN